MLPTRALQVSCQKTSSLPASPSPHRALNHLGAGDNGCAVAICLELIRNLVHSPQLPFDILFNLNDGEEQGLLGSYELLQYIKAKNETTVAAFINMDAAGKL